METLRNLSQTLINFFSFPLTDLKTSALLKQEFSVSPVCNSPGQRGKAHRLEKELRTPTRSTDHPKPSLQSSALFGSASNIMSFTGFSASNIMRFTGFSANQLREEGGEKRWDWERGYEMWKQEEGKKQALD